MSSVSGLSDHHRIMARDRTTQAAFLAINHRDRIHYTQSGARWNGIAQTKYSRDGEYPTYADCSSFATWCLWNGLWVTFHVRDTVNHLHWRAGFTGTMLRCGKPVQHIENVLRGDCVIYGRGYPGVHTAIVVGKGAGGVPMVASHGSERGPLFLRYDYRSDIAGIRRYI